MLHVVLTVAISALYMKNKGISQRLLTFIFLCLAEESKEYLLTNKTFNYGQERF